MLTSSRREHLEPDGKNLTPMHVQRYNDSFADALFDNAFRQEYNVSVSVVMTAIDYFHVSMGFLDNDSYVLGFFSL